MTEPVMEEYMMKTQDNYGSGVSRPKFDKDVKFELKGQILKELRDHTFSGSENKDANEHIERVLEIVDLFTTPDGKFLSKYCPAARTAKKMEEINNFQQKPDETLYQAWERFKKLLLRWHDGASTRHKSGNTSNGLAVIQAQLNNLSREIKKVNERVYAAQVGCELFWSAFPQVGRYRAAAPRFYQMDNGNPSYPEKRQNMEESLNKFMVESAKRHDEHSSLIKEI
ncbi:hypothetical protein Tco_1147856 [Tanacetum coccineum]